MSKLISTKTKQKTAQLLVIQRKILDVSMFPQIEG